MHPYVARQLRRHFGNDTPQPDLLPVLKAVSAMLHDVDRERELGAAAMTELSRELQQRYERMEQSEQRYRLLFDQNPLAMMGLRCADGTILAFNAQAEAVLGYVAADVVGRPLDELGITGPAQITFEQVLGSIEATGTTTQEFRLYSRDGREIETVVMCHRVELAGEEALIAHIRDVTAERVSLRAREESEARFRAFFEFAGISIHVLSFEGIILEANPASKELLGFDPHDVVGRSATSLSPPEDVEATRELARELRDGARDSVTVERRFFHKDGHLVWGQLTVSVVHHGGEKRMIGMIQDITERKRMEGQLLKQAFQDELTGLANRVLFRDRLRHALERRERQPTSVAVILLDLDGFKRVNDSLGHAVGDELLQVVGRRIASTVRAGETVARLGGDEFAVVIESIAHGEDPQNLADRLLMLLRMPMRVGGREVVVGVSIGIAIADVADDEETVLRNADTAMYAAKSSGKACVRRFDPSMHRDAMEWMELESDLRLGIDRREFILEFQPLMRIETGRPKGFEALVRWEHPSRGYVTPGVFLPIAEETGMIVALGRWVLMEACMKAQRWSEFSPEPLSVSVNVAAKQLDSEALIDDVRAALDHSGLSPSRLIVEITESDVMREPEVALAKLNALKALGVRLAIDDFGTGYSSLSHLQFFPVDELKIDRSFIQRIDDGDREAAFVRTIVSLAKSLRVEVVAEGVEEPAQHQFLRSVGCDIGQGYLYSRPLPAGQVERFVTDSRQVLPLVAPTHPRRLA
ncbi:putative bifunctional diguanylate cyclase/phosphodiesterase [Gemmatimonas sp.]|uniref:putative bifunctional diguanylate cyclase/phosphodiesterase n=1 Tax=Gemmatimonas sp. TaxID=1962908 RepID=UPI003F720068